MTSAITDKMIEALAEEIGINNKLDKLGLNLGYKFPALDIYKANNYNCGVVTYQGTKQMIKDWRNKTRQEQQRPQLKKALEDADLVMLAEKHLGACPDTTGEAVTGTEQTGKRETQWGQQPRTQPRTNTINASDSSNVSVNTMIGQQTVYDKSTLSAPVVHHHYTTNVKPAAPVRPIVIRPPAQKRLATPSPASQPPKRPKVAQARPSTSKAKTSKGKKSVTSKPKSTSQSKKVETPKAAKTKAPLKRQANPSPGPALKRQKVTEAKPSTSKATTSKRKKSTTSQLKSTAHSVKATSKRKSQTTPKVSKKKAPKSDKKKQTKKKKTPKTNKTKSQTPKAPNKRATKKASTKSKSPKKKQGAKKKKPSKTNKPKPAKKVASKKKTKKPKKK